MFSKVFALAALSILAVATAAPGGGGGGSPPPPPSDSCSTGPSQCCDTVTTASDPAAAGIISLLGIVVQDLTVGVGLTCSPITVIGVGGGTCSANAVCCQDNSHGGLISIGCVPVTL